MNILHLESSLGWGGQEIRIVKEALGMINRGHKVILAVAKGGKMIPYARKEGIKVYEVDFRKRNWGYCLFYLLYLFKKEGVEIINTHSSLDSWIGGIAAKIGGVAIIRTRHLSTAIRKGINSFLLYNKLADFVMTTCKGIIPMIASQSKNPLSKIRSVPTGIDISEIRFDKEKALSFRKELGISSDDLLVGMVCFMRSWKGVNDFIDAANLLRDDPHIKWVIIGGGHEEVYRKKAKELQLDSILFFTGHLNNPFHAIASLDIFSLLSTAHEGVSQASLQAAFLEKPLITTSVGGLPEVCLDQQTGIIVPSFSPQKVAEAVCFLKHNPLIRKKMGQNAKKHVENEFTQKVMLDHVQTIYDLIKK